MIIALGCDHIVTKIKNNVKSFLESLGHTVIDCGTYDDIRTHYPIYGSQVGKIVATKNADFGIVICGTGVGISNAASKIKGTRVVLTSNVITAIKAREEYDANILAMGGRIVGEGLMFEIIEQFLNAKYLNKNNELINKIDDLVKYENYDNKALLSDEIQKWHDGFYTEGEKQEQITLPKNYDIEFKKKTLNINNNYLFPQDFIFGGASAAYQIEGATDKFGRGKCVWDDWYHRPESTFNADVASDFYNLYPLDLKLGRDLGMNGIRISISWSRIFPNNSKDINYQGVKFYHELIDKCNELGVEPFVTLHHFDSPKWLSDVGDFTNKDSVNWFLEYAEFCFKEYGNKVKKWATFNEPYVYNSDKFIFGECPPCESLRIGKAIQGMHNMMVAHAKAVNAYKKMNLDGKIGIVHVLQPKYPYDTNDENDLIAAKNATVLYSQFMLDANYLGYYSDETLQTIRYLELNYNFKLDVSLEELKALYDAVSKTDFLGVNYYNPTWFVHTNKDSKIVHNGTGDKGKAVLIIKGIGEAKIPSNIQTTEWDWPIYPSGLYDILVWIKKRYPNYHEIYISENGIGYKETIDENKKLFDTYRVDYLNDHLQSCLKAIHEEKINLKGFYVWSWQDQFSWTNGYNKRYGLIYIDFENQYRYYKLSARWYQEVIKSKNLNVDIQKIKQDYKNEQPIKN